MAPCITHCLSRDCHCILSCWSTLLQSVNFIYYILTCLIMPVCRWLNSVGNATKGLVCTRVWSAVCLMMMFQSSSSTVTNVEYAALEEKRISSTATPVATAWTSNWKDPTKWATKVAVLPFSISKETVQCFTLYEACLWAAFAEVMHNIIYWVYGRGPVDRCRF